jgi:hypothetical protein
MKKILAVLVASVAMVSGVALGQPAVTEPAEESSFYGQLDLQYQATRNEEEGESVFGKVLYLEYDLNGEFSVFLSGYHDPGYWEVIPGLAKQVTEELMLGIGVGRARYDGRNWTVVNPWAYYEKNAVKALFFAEYIPKDRDEPWFFKGYVKWNFAKKYYAGIYGESFFGIGPMLGMSLERGWDLSVTAPIAAKPSEGKKRVMANLNYTF